jgi:hypothetical protein
MNGDNHRDSWWSLAAEVLPELLGELLGALLEIFSGH